MPQIQGYDSQVDASAPFGDTTPNLESASMVGRSLQNLGSSLDAASYTLHRREASAEISDTYATFAKGRADWMNELKQRMRNGTLDTEQFNQDYQDWVDKQSDNVSTGEGKDFFNRQAARLQGSLLMTAQHGQALMAGQKAVSDFQTSLNANSSTLMANPASFEDVYGSQMEAIDAQVKAGVIDPAKAQMLKDHASTELAKGAIRGWAKQDPGSLVNGVKGSAEKMLDQGAFDQFLNSDEKAQMYSYARQQANNADVDKARMDKLRDDAAAQQAEDWAQKAIPMLDKGTLRPQDVENAPLDADSKYKWIERIRASATQQERSNPQVVNAFFRRTQLPDDDPNKIESMDQILKDPQSKELSMSDFEHLSNFLKKTDEGQALKTNRNLLLNLAQQKLVKKNPMLGIQDPDGEKNLAAFTIDLQQAEKQQRAAGRPVMDLYNPASKDYFGNQIDKYVKTPQQLLQSLANPNAGNSPGAPATGTIQSFGGQQYRFKGGNHKDKNNWELVK